MFFVVLSSDHPNYQLEKQNRLIEQYLQENLLNYVPGPIKIFNVILTDKEQSNFVTSWNYENQTIQASSLSITSSPTPRVSIYIVDNPDGLQDLEKSNQILNRKLATALVYLKTSLNPEPTNQEDSQFSNPDGSGYTSKVMNEGDVDVLYNQFAEQGFPFVIRKK